MTYAEAMERFTEEEAKASQGPGSFIRLYYQDRGWDPCVPILATTRARFVPHPSCSTIRCMHVVEVSP